MGPVHVRSNSRNNLQFPHRVFSFVQRLPLRYAYPPNSVTRDRSKVNLLQRQLVIRLNPLALGIIPTNSGGRLPPGYRW